MMLVPTAINVRRNAVKDLVDQYNEKVSGVVSCFDRVLFKGYLPLRFGTAMERFMGNQGCFVEGLQAFCDDAFQNDQCARGGGGNQVRAPVPLSRPQHHQERG